MTDFVTVKDASNKIGVTNVCLYNWIERELIPHVSVGHNKALKPDLVDRVATIADKLDDARKVAAVLEYKNIINDV